MKNFQNNFTHGIGNTPLIKLRAASEITGCNIYGKAEFLNPGGSVKDRAALGLIRDAEEKKLYAQNMKSVSVKEEAKARPPKIKGLSLYGSEISGLRQGMKTFSAKPVVSKGKLGYKVMDEFGGFETLDLKAFAKKFG